MSAPPISARPIGLAPAQLSDEDAQLVMRWRNDPLTRSVSFHQDEKTWPAFGAEYRGYFAGAPIPPQFGVEFSDRDSATRIAFLRFRTVEDPEGQGGRAVDISINVAPDARGGGLGTRIIAEATRFALTRADVVLAEIRPGNAPSVRAFLGAGYRRISDGRHEVDGARLPVERFVVRRSEERDRG